MINKRICINCNKDFIGKSLYANFCCPKCRIYYRRKKQQRINKGQVLSAEEKDKFVVIRRIFSRINNLQQKIDNLGKKALYIEPEARKIYAIMKRDNVFHLSHSEFIARYEAELKDVVVVA